MKHGYAGAIWWHFPSIAPLSIVTISSELQLPSWRLSKLQRWCVYKRTRWSKKHNNKKKEMCEVLGGAVWIILQSMYNKHMTHHAFIIKRYVSPTKWPFCRSITQPAGFLEENLSPAVSIPMHAGICPIPPQTHTNTWVYRKTVSVYFNMYRVISHSLLSD